jgi:molecular chaperone DnaK
VDGATKANITEHVDKVKKAMEGEDAEAIKQASEELMKASHKLAEQVYAHTAGGAGPEGAGAQQQAQQKKPEEDVVEAEFEEVK